MGWTPEIAIGMPLYNGGRWLREALDSLLAQTFTDFELVISDNASTDDSRAICEDYARRDRRIRYVRSDTNVGARLNYNRAFTLTSSPFFKWASSNDVCDPEMLRKCYDVMRADPDVALCHTRARLIQADGTAVDYAGRLDVRHASAGARFRGAIELLQLNNAMNGLFRSDVLRQTDLLANYHGSDMILTTAAALYGKIVQVPEFLFYRRMHPDATTVGKSAEDFARFYNPEMASRIVLPIWRQKGGYFNAIRRAPLSGADKLRLFGWLGRTLLWEKGPLARELGAAVRRVANMPIALRPGAPSEAHDEHLSET